MTCVMYSHGKCRKQPTGTVSSGLLFRVATTTFAACQFDGRVWVGDCAYAGRHQNQSLRHEDCAMFVPGPSKEAEVSVVAATPQQTDESIEHLIATMQPYQG